MTLDLLMDMAWKSGLVVTLVLAGGALLRHRPPAERVLLLRLGVVVTLCLPPLAAAMPELRIATPVFATRNDPAAGDRAASAPTVPLIRPDASPPAPAFPEIASQGSRPGAPAPMLDRMTIPTGAVALYLAGTGLLVLRLIAGLAALGLWTGRARRIIEPAWLLALQRAAQGGPCPRLLASSRVTSPLSWGLHPGVILINENALPETGRAVAVLTHEVAHVRRGDWLFLILSRLLVALFWFNPLVWILQRELARQSEHAADAWAVRRMGRADYASALVAMAARARPHAALGMAPPRTELARRVSAVLNDLPRKGSPWLTALTAACCVGFATPLAALAFGGDAREVPADRSSPTSAPVIAAAPLSRPEGRFETVSGSRADDPVAAARRAAAVRQRNLGLALMEAGARTMEERAREMRVMAARSLDADERASMIEEAAELEREAAALRGEARELAARDPATLKPMTPEEEREMTESLGQMVSIGDNPPFVARGPVTVSADALFLPPPTPTSRNVAPPAVAGLATDESGGYRAANGVEVDASGALRTSGGVRMDASGQARAPNGVRIDSAGQVRAPNGARIDADGEARGASAAELAAAREQMRTGAGQLRDGARQMEAAAAMTELSATTTGDAARQTEIRARAADMRRQASDLRRQADAMEPDG